MARRTASLLLLLAVAWSGCFGGSPAALDSTSSPETPTKIYAPPFLHSLERIEAFEVRATDGIALRGHVYLPNGSGPFATVMDLSPYWNSGEFRSDKQEEFEEGRRTIIPLYRSFLDAGMAVAFVALRGTGGSEGCFQFSSPSDWSDAAAIIGALAAKPWSNGNVGMYGISYAGWTQYMALSAGPPALKAVLPVSGVIDYWSLITRNGAPISTTPALQAQYTVDGSVGLFGSTGILLVAAYNQWYSSDPSNIIPDAPHFSHFTCPEHASNTPPNLELAWNGDRGPHFEQRDYRSFIRNTTIPIFITNGLTGGEGHIQQFDGLWDMIPHDNKRFMLGQWGHLFPEMGGREDFPAMAAAWFHHHLQGGPKTIATGVVEYEDDTGQWHNATRWPPPSTTASLLLSGQKIVSPTESVEAASQTFQAMASDPSLSVCPGQEALFVSPPLANDILIAGNFWLNFTLTSNLPDGNLAAFLYHTPSAGPCPFEDAEQAREALTDLRHWERTGQGRDFPTNTPTSFHLRSLPLASVIPAGHRLVLAVGGSGELTPDPRLPRLTITTGPGILGSLELPIAQGELVFK